MKAGVAIAVTTVLALGVVPAAAGQGAGGGAPGGRLMERLDLDGDGDGAVSRDEAREFGDLRFRRWGRDGDGAVTEAEMVGAAQERAARRAGKMFARLDANGDGRLERAELEARGTAFFDRIDADGVGRVSIEEVRSRWHAGRHDGKSTTSD